MNSLLTYLLWTVMAVLSALTAGHALIYKRDPRSALGWMVICLFFPPVGPLCYFFFGINRIRTRARELTAGKTAGATCPGYVPVSDEDVIGPFSSKIQSAFERLAQTTQQITGTTLVQGNRIDLLENGENAYPAMLEAINRAEHSLYLTTYIFNSDSIGHKFINALDDARKRGVDVRVILDGVGEWYSLPRAGSYMKSKRIPFARFLPPRLIPPTFHVNLRNHRKILIADGETAFMGGMNISDRHMVDGRSDPHRIVDTHFRILGPAARQIEAAFIRDWMFCTGEAIIPRPVICKPWGNVICRTILDGPDDDIDTLLLTILSAIHSARRRIYLMTPYFLPPRELTGALQTAALRGVSVHILLPGRNNLPFVKWASENMLWELLERGVRVYYQPDLFVHAKLLIIDNYYTQIGSANIDPRSLRLNFEMNLEIFDRHVALTMADYFRRRLEASREIFLQDVDSRSLPTRIRDSFFWLFSPFL